MPGSRARGSGGRSRAVVCCTGVGRERSLGLLSKMLSPTLVPCSLPMQPSDVDSSDVDHGRIRVRCAALCCGARQLTCSGMAGPGDAESVARVRRCSGLPRITRGRALIAGIAAAAVWIARSRRLRAWRTGAAAFLAPWMLQLVGAGLISSNSPVGGLMGQWGPLVGGAGGLPSAAAAAAPAAAPPRRLAPSPPQALNWFLRLSCFFAWLLFMRPRWLSAPAVSGSSLEQHGRDGGAPSVTSAWREQAEVLQKRVKAGWEDVASRRTAAKAKKRT